MPYTFNPFTSNFDYFERLTNPLLFKGDIAVNTSFPLIASVQSGWFYTISASVTDNAGATYTNTGQSFISGDEIAWNGTNWTLMGNLTNAWLKDTAQTGLTGDKTGNFNLNAGTGYIVGSANTDGLMCNGFTAAGVAASTLSWVDGVLGATRTFTITGSHDIYINGVKSTKPTASIQIADTTGTHWIYYNASGVLSETTTVPAFNLPFIATVYWNTTTDKGILGNERHGITMDWANHELLHNTVGTRYESGLAGTFGNTTFSIATGIWHDEDIENKTVAPSTTCDLFYKNGAADFEWTTNNTVYYYTSGGNLYYNNGNTLTAADSNKYVAIWIFTTNNVNRPIVSLIGQRQDTTIADARINNKYENLTLGALPFQEMKLLYRVILRNDATPYEETQDLRTISNLPAGTYVATAHNTLTGLTTGDDHTQYVLNDGESTDITNGTFNLTTTGTGTFGSGIYDNAGTPALSIDPNNRILYANDGTTSVLNYYGTFGQMPSLLINEASPWDNSVYFEVNGKGGFNSGGGISAYFNDGTYAINATGNANITGTATIGAYTLPNTDGNDGDVLTTDGAGTVAWEASGAGFSFPIGGVIVWAGLRNTIPTYWQECDGTNGTPDWRGYFIRGATSGEEPDNTAYGSNSHSHTLDIDAVLDHSHGVAGNVDAVLDHNHGLSSGSTDEAGAHTHTASGTVDSVGDHNHSISDGYTCEAGCHCHTASGNVDSAGDHYHSIGDHCHYYCGTTGYESALCMVECYVVSATYVADCHTHGYCGYTDCASGDTGNAGDHYHSACLSTDEQGNHCHSFSGLCTGDGGGHDHSASLGTDEQGNHSHTFTGFTTDDAGGHDHAININTGDGGAHGHSGDTDSQDNVPEYKSGIWIMYLGVV